MLTKQEFQLYKVGKTPFENTVVIKNVKSHETTNTPNMKIATKLDHYNFSEVFVKK